MIFPRRDRDLCRFAFFGLRVMTLSYTQYWDDDMFLQEHFDSRSDPVYF